MFKFLLYVLVIGAGYYIYTNHSPFQTEVTDPYYLELRIKDPDTSVKLVGFGKMNSLADCEARGLLFWKETFRTTGQIKKTSECKKEIAKKFMKLFHNKQMNATYLVFDKGNKRERDGRFLLYGVPSSHVKKWCDKFIKTIKTDYTGTISCIQGKVG